MKPSDLIKDISLNGVVYAYCIPCVAFNNDDSNHSCRLSYCIGKDITWIWLSEDLLDLSVQEFIAYYNLGILFTVSSSKNRVQLFVDYLTELTNDETN